jgi:Flp pilus assembly protein TadG
MWTLRKRSDQIRNSNQVDAMNHVLPLSACRERKLRASRGQTLLEFALVFPMFLMLICGVVDFSHVFYAEMTVQNALRQAGRFATTGNHLQDSNGNNLSRVSSIITTAQQAAPGFDFSQINISSVAGGAGSAGGPGDIVTISLSSAVPMLTPIMAPFFKPNGAYSFTVSVTFKNEPFLPGQTT